MGTLKKILDFQSSRNASHLKNLCGLLAVFQCLMANISESNKISRLSYMNLEEAFTLFLSYHEDTTEYFIRDPHRRNQFKELLCHPNYGLGVYIVSGE